MNVLFFLTPKNEVIYEKPDSTMRQALERMEHHRYSAIPLIDQEGKYVGTITEGDLLWKLKNTPNLSFINTNKILLKDVPRHMDNVPVSVDSNIQDLVYSAINQNFVPVVDDSGIFIGIIKRSDIIHYCYESLYGKKLKIARGDR